MTNMILSTCKAIIDCVFAFNVGVTLKLKNWSGLQLWFTIVKIVSISIDDAQTVAAPVGVVETWLFELPRKSIHWLWLSSEIVRIRQIL
jgi:hypothetical protein